MIRPPVVGVICAIARAIVDFPAPDSPTIPSDAPASTANDTSSTAVSARAPRP